MLVTQTDLENKLGRVLTSEEAVNFTLINTAIQSYVEKMIGSSVEAESLSTRYYDGGMMNLAVDPCTDIDKVEYVDTYENSEYIFDDNEITVEPRNSTLKTMLRLRYKKFNNGFNNIAVTAKFSTYADDKITAIIKNTILDANVELIEGKEDVSSESIEGYSVTYKVKDNDSIKALNSIIQNII
jgi:hypothetical protein